MGQRVNGTQAWFAIGPFQLQPSELSKVTMILFMASVASMSAGALRLRSLMVCLGILAVPAALTLLQPDLGTTSALCAISMGILLVAGARARHILVCTVLALVAVVVLLGTNQLKDYQQARLTAFVIAKHRQGRGEPALPDRRVEAGDRLTAASPGRATSKGDQTNGALRARAAHRLRVLGGRRAVRLRRSACCWRCTRCSSVRIWRTAQLVEGHPRHAHLRGRARRCSSGRFQNVGMTMGIMPMTGIPLPLLSYGGSSTIAFLALIGLVENVHMRRFT